MRLPVAILVLLCVSLTSCKDQSEASAILPKVCKAFPDSVIYKMDRRVLWVQTHVDGISASTAEALFANAIQQASIPLGKITINIQEELNIDGKQFLIVGFRNFWIVWTVANGCDAKGMPIGCQVMNEPMLKEWVTSHTGHAPDPSQIYVVTLQDALNNPKGEPMQLQTLAQRQAEKRAKLVQEVQDYNRQQQVLQN